MPIWDDAYLLRHIEQAERELTTDVKCIFNRFSLEIVAGTSTYALPDNLNSIIEVTYKGDPVFPYSHRLAREQGFSERIEDNSVGPPMLYFTYGHGFNNIKFWPTPNENIAADDSGINGPDIRNRAIISCYRIADPATLFRLPEYVRRRFIKYYVGARVSAQEGKGISLKYSQYYKARYDIAKAQLRKTIETVPRAVRLELQPSVIGPFKPARPVLPSNFGVPVE